MTIQARLVVAGMSATEAAASVGTSSFSLTAITGGQSAAAILGADQNRFATVPSGGGCILPAMNPGDSIIVVNAGANALALYPPVGGQINALGTNTAYSILTTTPFCTVNCFSPTQYHAFQSS
jgi:hypothetical protein